jgi:hypothetical protein
MQHITTEAEANALLRELSQRRAVVDRLLRPARWTRLLSPMCALVGVAVFQTFLPRFPDERLALGMAAVAAGMLAFLLLDSIETGRRVMAMTEVLSKTGTIDRYLEKI